MVLGDADRFAPRERDVDRFRQIVPIAHLVDAQLHRILQRRDRALLAQDLVIDVVIGIHAGKGAFGRSTIDRRLARERRFANLTSGPESSAERLARVLMRLRDSNS